MNTGKLYVVSTPIGNLDDITYRAVDTLKAVDLIAAEDTRHTGRLLSNFGIQTRQIPYHDHNKEKVTPRILDEITDGKNVAVVSDAGTPGISDPGFYLIRQCLQSNIEVIPVPGASSMLAALVSSGMATDRFAFEGFLPRTKGKAVSRLNEIKDDARTLIFFESPHRLGKTLALMLEVFGERNAYVGRELTKKFEEHYYGAISGLISEFSDKKPKGEIVIVISGK